MLTTRKIVLKKTVNNSTSQSQQIQVTGQTALLKFGDRQIQSMTAQEKQKPMDSETQTAIE